ncbi:uncharacterized protein LOC115456144 isoform X2 [Manduca sexta]|uniref:uncharacterized protein LOC115456144 isoform X2 n=1 Tax=Manduca sexta TaxID=7130 RepID=UPI00188E81B5|nr:uncharacterized protein LOC115456144 isoform X2 [Manduca sexta]
MNSNTSIANCNYISSKDVKQIVYKYLNTKKVIIESYSIERASEKMLGYLYLKPWSAELVETLNDAMVFEDLNALDYKLHDKFHRFDMQHILQALNTIARFHASSIIYEEKQSNKLQRSYRLDEDFGQVLDKAGYSESSPWFLQCMNGALEAIKVFIEFNDKDKSLIESRWNEIWLSALSLSSPSNKYKNVVSHRDLWNNNILFHYDNKGEPDECVLVDFQAIRYQPPAGDVMLLLCCNLDPKFREEHLTEFLNHYYEELKRILQDNGIIIEDILTKDEFFASAEEQRKWGLVICACLLPQVWIDDDQTMEIFSDAAQYDDILLKNKAAFIIKMMKENVSYQEKVMEIFIEIVGRYCLE